MNTPNKPSNFQILATYEPLLERLGRLAERYFADDPNTCLIKLRQFGEILSQEVAARVGMFTSPDENQLVLLNRLWESSVIPPAILQLFHGLRKAGNLAVHHHAGQHNEALHQLKMATKLAVWFHRAFGNDPQYKSGPFLPPTPPLQQDDSLKEELQRLQQQLDATRTLAERAQAAAAEEAQKRLTAEERAEQQTQERQVWEEIAQEYEAKYVQRLVEQQTLSKQQPPQQLDAIVSHAYKIGQDLDLTEAETRRLIDQKLADAGWEVDSVQLTYKNGARPQPHRNLAIAEWPTQDGRADYVLFLGLQAVAVVEAKRAKKDVAASIEQSKRYSRGYLIQSEESLPHASPWGDYKIPFLFATNGRPFLQQLRTESGIWFLDVRRPQNLSRPLLDWMTPEGLQHLLSQDIDAVHQHLAQEPTDYLRLRDYQIRAIHAVEQAIAQGERTCLLAMATGTGKTKTCVGLIYRLIKTRCFRRVLFLVDRTALGEQATTAFKETQLEQFQAFSDIFDVKELKDLLPEPETKLHFATVQGMVKRLFSPSSDDTLPIDQYDCIVVDESHRGYNLDRELSDVELDFRDQRGYISTYRRVLDHFDAVKIGLTATPALHTIEIFGLPIFQYSYREAVIDGWLVDHEPPIRITTALAEDGIHWDAGEDVMIYRPDVQQLDLIQLEDEIHLEIDSFNKKVLSDGFNFAVCGELAKHLDPASDQKTLIFCATDKHADKVVDILKRALQDQYGSVEDDAVVKITGASDKPNLLIRRFRNERLPNIAVTVDLLTTGIDIPSICNLVFLRRVKSRILYEQMLGRATRLCPEIQKESFRIFDAVRLYEALEPFSSMKPVVTRPKIPFAQLAQELHALSDEQALQSVHSEFMAKLQRKAHGLSEQTRQHFEEIAQISLADILSQAHTLPPKDFASWLAQRPNVCDLLDRIGGGGTRPLLVHEGDDHVRRVEMGYGTGDARPEDYLAGFQRFLLENQNRIPALLTVLTRPRDLTRQQLKELKIALDAAGYTETQLQQAWRQITNQDIAASIVGFVRQQALREDLRPYEQRVQAALQKILQSRAWTKPQRDWLTKIGNQIIANVVVDRTSFEEGFFKLQAGGFDRLNKVFDHHLEEILSEMNDALWQQAS